MVGMGHRRMTAQSDLAPEVHHVLGRLASSSLQAGLARGLHRDVPGPWATGPLEPGVLPGPGLLDCQRLYKIPYPHSQHHSSH